MSAVPDEKSVLATTLDLMREEWIAPYRQMADAARRFVIADLELEESLSRCDPGVVIAAMAAKHDLRLLAGLPCGCEEGSCEGLIG